jgi:PAS domain S-box-containing protein
MIPLPASSGRSYAVALIATLAAVLLRWAADPWLGNDFPVVTVYAAVAVAVYHGGYRPAIVSLVLGYVACDYLFSAPRFSLSHTPYEYVGVVLFLLTNAIIIAFGQGMRASRLRAADGRELLAVTLASIGDAVITTDRAGRITYLNNIAESLTGWAREDAIGQPLDAAFRIVDEESRQPIENPAARAMGDGALVGLAGHTVLIAKDGTERPIDDSAAPIRSREGELLGSVLTFRDVGDQRRYERELQYANRRKDEFLATLAHELRNPLAPIRNALQVVLAHAPSDASVQQSQQIIDRQLKQMARLLDDLLDVSRIVYNKLELRKERIELRTAIQTAVETARPAVEASRQELIVDLPPQPVLLSADPVRLAQVLSNLLSNAAKYTAPEGHIRLAARQRGDQVEISVRDDGAGIAAGALPRIFDLFAQNEPMFERSKSGLGIGLALVRGLVELHGGSVEARSDGPGKGSEFIVRLPVIAAQTVRESAVNEEAIERAGMVKRRVLVVDDVKDSADSLAMLLRMMGHEVHAAYAGEQAIKIAARLQPEVIILDIGMPRPNGYDVCRRIRAEGWGQRAFIAALTGWGQEDARLRGEESGFDYHLVKPVSPDTLRKLFAYLPPRRMAS